MKSSKKNYQKEKKSCTQFTKHKSREKHEVNMKTCYRKVTHTSIQKNINKLNCIIKFAGR